MIYIGNIFTCTRTEETQRPVEGADCIIVALNLELAATIGPIYNAYCNVYCNINKTSQELRMLSSVTLNCQVTKIVMNSGSQLSEL